MQYNVASRKSNVECRINVYCQLIETISVSRKQREVAIKIWGKLSTSMGWKNEGRKRFGGFCTVVNATDTHSYVNSFLPIAINTFSNKLSNDRLAAKQKVD